MHYGFGVPYFDLIQRVLCHATDTKHQHWPGSHGHSYEHFKAPQICLSHFPHCVVIECGPRAGLLIDAMLKSKESLSWIHSRRAPLASSVTGFDHHIVDFGSGLLSYPDTSALFDSFTDSH